MATQTFYRNHLLEVESSTDADYPWKCSLTSPDQDMKAEFELSVGCNCNSVVEATTQAKTIADQVIDANINWVVE